MKPAAYRIKMEEMYMDRAERKPNWMNYSPMLKMYRQAQSVQGILEPDMEFLSEVNLGRYRKYILDRFGLPDNIYNFLNQTGLPDRFITWRSPDEEMEDKNKQSCSGVFFTLRCLRTEKIKKRDFFVIGEDWSMGRCSEVCGDEWTWWKEEECTCIVADISTGEIWQWFHYTDTDFLAYINSSLEQYLLSMAYWRAFYPLLAQKTSEFTAKNPEETELDYIFKHHKTLYTPFWERIKALDPEAAKKRNGYWRFMSDLSLY